MSHEYSPTQGGIITVHSATTGDGGGGDYRSWTIGGEGSDEPYHLTISGIKARKIHMVNIPSATTIELQSKDMNGDVPVWWMKLKTTHAPSDLQLYDIDQYVNRYVKGDFIITALGMLVVDKSTTPAARDSLGRIIVKTSAGRRPTAK